MNHKASMEQYGISSDLNQIIRELEEISVDLRRLRGIGAENCSTKLIQLSQKYNSIKNRVHRL